MQCQTFHLISSYLLEFIVKNGIVANTDSPYSAVQNDCQSPPPPQIRPVLATTATEYYLGGDEEKLKALLCQNGPMAVVIQASPVFLTYKSGIFYDSADNCPRDCRTFNHAMVLVGKKNQFICCTLFFKKICDFRIWH